MLARRKSGFTLIELLVVIAIIAILAAILFPVFARARETARKSNCTNNMKECAVAIQVYWNDYDSTLPSSAINAGTAGGAGNAQAFCTGYGASAAQLALPPAVAAGTIRYSWAQVVYDYMKNKDIMFCPSDGNKETYPGTNNATNGLSYWWKTAANDAWNPTNATTVVTCRKESDFVYGSDQIILYEHSGFHSGEISLKPGTQINVAFLDTHVKNVALKDSAGLVDATGIQNGGEPMYYNWDFENDKVPTSGAISNKNCNARTQGDKI